MATIKGLKKRSADLLNGLAHTIYNPDKQNFNEIYDIGKEKLSPNSKRALVIYVINGVRSYLDGSLEDFSLMNYHSMWQESIEMLKTLNNLGYIVDYFNVYTDHVIDWHKYDLVFDERNSLTNSPRIAGQKKVSYATGCYWLNHNFAEISRIKQFYERNKVIVPPARQLKPNFSDLFADHLTYFGNENQLTGFSEKIKKHPLNISAHIPVHNKKDIDSCRNKFLWIGSGGLILKGLDLTIEAFMRMPDAELFIAGNLSHEPVFLNWCDEVMKKHKNIHYLGWVDVTSENFKQIADNCIGTVYPGCSEGGAGSVVQAMQFGLIPITTEDSNLRGNHHGKIINEKQDSEIINKIVDYVHEIKNLSEKELQMLSEKIRVYARNTFNINKYMESLGELIQLIN